MEHGSKNPIKGRIVFDLKMGYEKLTDGDIGYTSLKNALEDNNAPIKKLEGMDDYEKDFESFLQYNKRDVEGTVWIDENLSIINTFLERQKLVGCKFTDTYYNKDMCDVAFLRKAKEKGIVLPNGRKHDAEPYEGATIYDPVIGFHTNVIVLDCFSMYPSSMEASNMSFETILKDKNEVAPEYLIKLGNGVCFRKDKIGLTTELLHDVQDYRDFNKKERDKFSEDSPEWKKFDNKQRVAKFLKNSTYGVFAFRSFRLYNVNIAKSITWLSRQALAHVRETIETNYPDCEVLYGHSDSVFVKVPKNPELMAEKLQETINSSWGIFEAKYNLIPGKYKIEIDKIFKTLLLAGANRYTGKLLNDKLIIKGFEAKKRSVTPIIRDLQITVINNILDHVPRDKTFAYIKDIANTIRSGNCKPDEIAIKMKIKKPFSAYRNVPAHVAAAKWAMENIGLSYNVGDVVKMVVVEKNDAAKKYNVKKDGVIAYENEEFVKNFEIDGEKMIKKLIPGKLDLIFLSMGWQNLDDLLEI